MILKKKIEDAGLKIEIVKNYIKPSPFNKKIKIEYLIFNLDNIPFELSTIEQNEIYVLSNNWKIILGCYNFQEVVSLLENTELLVKLTKGKVK